MSILIVDDDAGIRQLVTLFLEHKGYQAVGVANGLEALEHLRDSQTELILLDLMMPVMNGAEFRDAQLHDSQLAAIPVVVMSAAENIDAHAPSLAADSYRPKPIDFGALIGLVERHC